jgi:putative transposase
VEACWDAIPDHFVDVRLDEFVVMPNHLHGVLVIGDGDDGEGKAFAAFDGRTDTENSRANALPLRGTQPHSVGAIVQNFKSTSTRKINWLRRSKGEPV